jgi:hypothetical protein
MTDLKTILSENTEAAKTSVKEIHTFINDEVDSNATLEFDSVSKVSEWNLWTEVVSFLSYIMQLQWLEAKAELTTIKETGIAANRFFFAREWKNFQFGDSLLVNDATGKYYYETIDPTKQIIKRLAIVQAINQWVVKVATESAGLPVALSAPQLAAFQSYLNRTQPPGAQVKALSLDSDKIKALITIYHDPLEPIAELKAAIEAAYLAYISKIDINGDSVYYISRHVDSLQAVTGVSDVIVGEVQCKIDSQPYAVISRKYEPFSGYLEHDSAVSLDDVFTYIAE